MSSTPSPSTVFCPTAPLPRVVLYTPDGAPIHFKDCVINDSLIPDLSFEGVDVTFGKRVRIVTSLPYMIVR